MRVIRKEISVEPFTSRLPSVLPAYLDNELYFFDDKSLKNREYLYPSNYGMVPVNIVLNVKPYSSITSDEYEIVSGDHCYGDKENFNYDEFGYFTMSFNTLSKWYNEFEEYYSLLNEHSHCGLVYSGAVDYYIHESGEKYADQMLYGVDKQIYIDIDEKFAQMGARPVFYPENGETVDEGFFKWICENIVPSFTIPYAYQNYWKTKKLYYPDVIHWISWFDERLDYEDYYKPATSAIPESWDCKNSGVSDCCDCEEYFNRGGERTYLPMLAWYNALQDGIGYMNNAIIGNESCFIPTIIFPTSLQNNIDDIGQFSVLSKDYEVGTDYRVADGYGASANTKDGTVVTYNGESKILSGNGLGFCFDENLMEMVYKDSDWANYTDKFIRENPELFVSSSYTYYTYDDDGMVVTTDKTELAQIHADLNDKLSKKYEIVNGDWFVDGVGVLHPVEKREFGTIWNNVTGAENKYIVYRDEHTETPYTIIDGKKIFAELYTNKINGKLYFYFNLFKAANSPQEYASLCGEMDDGFSINKYKLFPRRAYKGDDDSEYDFMSFFEYNGLLYEFDDSEVIFYIDFDQFIRVVGYAIDDDGRYIYLFAGDSIPKVLNYSVFNDIVANITYEDWLPVEVSIPIGHDIDVYSVSELTGTTTSKIYDLRLSNLLVDDIGNTIEGVYDPMAIEAKNHQPAEGSEIELMYQVGNVANVDKINGMTNAPENNGDNYFIGDIITEMKFYYNDVDGNVYEPSVYRTYLDSFGSKCIEQTGYNGTGYTSLSAITYARNVKEEKEASQTENLDEEYVFFDEDIYCDITYYVGATLRRMNVRNGSTPFVLAGEVGDYKYNEGVEYKETVKFKKTPVEYYRVKGKNGLESNKIPVSYPIYVYTLEQEMVYMENTTYGTMWNVALATFRTRINLVNSDFSTTFSDYKDMDTYNGIQAYPVFKEEYLMGISSLENIDANIYIERGINAAFEKHLKLGEVRSLDDVISYGNGYFKIMED